MQEISYQLRVVIQLPDDFPTKDILTNATMEFVTSGAIYEELLRNVESPVRGVSLTVSSERLDR